MYGYFVDDQAYLLVTVPYPSERRRPAFISSVTDKEPLPDKLLFANTADADNMYRAKELSLSKT